MKRALKFTAVVIFAGMLFSTTTIGQTTNTGKNFVDKDKNGICDNRDVKQDNAAKGRNYSDANNDGVCDNRAVSNKGKGKCCGQKQQGCRYRGGRK